MPLRQFAQLKKNRETIERNYVTPVKIIWQRGNIKNVEKILKPGNGQAVLPTNDLCLFKSSSNESAAILLDFGKEIHGGAQIVTGLMKSKVRVKVRLRFGESVSEAMSDINVKGATNDHSLRDFIIELPWLGKIEVGNTGFRFLRIDIEDTSSELLIKEIRAIAVQRNLKYIGSFNSSDQELNKIWKTGAYTVHLNMQEYLWDGIKRDRLVWVGDMHPEVSAIKTVFGYSEVVPKSLDLARDITPLPQWMNGISTYSMWWIIIHRDWYLQNGDLNYLKQQRTYLLPLLKQLAAEVDEQNREKLTGNRFLDWPSSKNDPAIHAGLQSMLIMALDAGSYLCTVLGEKTAAAQCKVGIVKLKKHIPDVAGSKQAAALLSLSGLMDAQKANNEVLSIGGAKDFSTFFGYYMLEAKAKAGDYQGSIDAIKQYWGAMLKLGATTFWEDFNLDWVKDAAGIDNLVPAGKKDIHGDFGAYCYIGLRHSLCHGWSAGPTAWLTNHVLGVKILEPGCKKIQIVPHLGNLKFAEGTYPTPYGIIKIKHVLQSNGKIKTTVSGPKQVTITYKPLS